MGTRSHLLLLVVQKASPDNKITRTKGYLHHRRALYRRLQGRGPSYIHFIT